MNSPPAGALDFCHHLEVSGRSYVLSRRGSDVLLEFSGYFAEAQAVEALAQFESMVPFGQPFRFVVDLEHLQGYDKESRIIWQGALAPRRKDITQIVFVGNPSAIIRMAASAVALAIGVRMRFVDSQADVWSNG